MTVLTAADAVVGEIGSNAWAGTVPLCVDSIPCMATPWFAAPLRGFVKPLELIMDEFLPKPGALYSASSTWEQATGDVADIGQELERLCKELESLKGELADAIRHALAVMAYDSHRLANWTKIVSQALQLCVTIFESVRIFACQALDLLSDFGRTIWDVLFGSWPWEFDKKGEAISEFAREVERFVATCSALGDQALQAGRDLIRLLTDLNRAINPFHQELENLLGAISELIPAGTPPTPSPDAGDGYFGDIYHPSNTPYPGSDLRIEGDYDFGYQHSYDLGATHLSQEELMAMFQENFGQLFVPSRVGDNTQLNMQLTHEDQLIETSLFGTAIPEVTTGMIVVQQITSDGFVIAAKEGHPEEPGEVAFRLTVDGGRAHLQVTAGYGDTILGKNDFGSSINTNPLFAAITDHTIWSDMQHRIQDKLQYG